VIETRVNPCYNYKKDEPISADMAIMVLDKDVVFRDETTEIPKVYNSCTSGSEVSKKFTLMGWGDSGTIGSKPRDLDEFGGFHAGENRWTKVDHGMLIYKMDKQINGGLPLEAIAWSGDSGGPAFIADEETGELQIAGVNSNGDCCKYGNEDEYTRLGGISYKWI